MTFGSGFSNPSGPPPYGGNGGQNSGGFGGDFAGFGGNASGFGSSSGFGGTGPGSGFGSLAGGDVSGWGNTQPPAPASPDGQPGAPRRQSVGRVLLLAGAFVVAAAVAGGGIAYFSNDNGPKSTVSGSNSAGSGSGTQNGAIAGDETVGVDVGDADTGGSVETDTAVDGSVSTQGDASELETKADSGQIYWQQQGFEALEENPEGLYPGSGFLTIDQEKGTASLCSTGWLVGQEGDHDHVYMLTAGHCGKVGDEIYIPVANGDPIPAGRFVWSQGGEPGGIDHALVDVTDAPNLQSALPLGDQLQISGWRGAEWVRENKPYTCRIGAKNGLSCGAFTEMESEIVYRYENISNHGDSGGAVWAQDPKSGNWYAVALTSFGSAEDATNAGAVTIEPVMDYFNLKIYG